MNPHRVQTGRAGSVLFSRRCSSAPPQRGQKENGAESSCGFRGTVICNVYVQGVVSALRLRSGRPELVDRSTSLTVDPELAERIEGRPQPDSQYNSTVMSILKVARMGHPVLRAKTRAIERSDIKTATVQK